MPPGPCDSSRPQPTLMPLDPASTSTLADWAISASEAALHPFWHDISSLLPLPSPGHTEHAQQSSEQQHPGRHQMHSRPAGIQQHLRTQSAASQPASKRWKSSNDAASSATFVAADCERPAVMVSALALWPMQPWISENDQVFAKGLRATEVEAASHKHLSIAGQKIIFLLGCDIPQLSWQILVALCASLLMLEGDLEIRRHCQSLLIVGRRSDWLCTM